VADDGDSPSDSESSPVDDGLDLPDLIFETDEDEQQDTEVDVDGGEETQEPEPKELDLRTEDSGFDDLLARTLGGSDESGKPTPLGPEEIEKVLAASLASSPPKKKSGVEAYTPARMLNGLARKENKSEPKQAPAAPIHVPESKAIGDLKEKVKLMNAETETYRRRITAQAETARTEGHGDACKALLPVMDALALAMKAAADVENGEKLVDGLELVMKQLHSALGALGLESIEAHGEPFDPTVHEALHKMHTGEVPVGSVAEVIRQGYQFNGKLLRPAQVVVESEG